LEPTYSKATTFIIYLFDVNNGDGLAFAQGGLASGRRSLRLVLRVELEVEGGRAFREGRHRIVGAAFGEAEAVVLAAPTGSLAGTI